MQKRPLRMTQCTNWRLGIFVALMNNIAVDDGLQCSPMPTNRDIVSSVMQVSEEDKEGDDTGDPLPSVLTSKLILLSRNCGHIS